MPAATEPSPPRATWREGSVILGRYRLEALLRRGGMGSVWRAEHVELVAGAVAFVLSGGARALHEADLAHSPARAAAGPLAAPTLERPPEPLGPRLAASAALGRASSPAPR